MCVGVCSKYYCLIYNMQILPLPLQKNAPYPFLKKQTCFCVFIYNKDNVLVKHHLFVLDYIH